MAPGYLAWRRLGWCAARALAGGGVGGRGADAGLPFSSLFSGRALVLPASRLWLSASASQIKVCGRFAVDSDAATASGDLGLQANACQRQAKRPRRFSSQMAVVQIDVKDLLDGDECPYCEDPGVHFHCLRLFCGATFPSSAAARAHSNWCQPPPLPLSAASSRAQSPSGFGDGDDSGSDGHYAGSKVSVMSWCSALTGGSAPGGDDLDLGLGERQRRELAVWRGARECG